MDFYLEKDRHKSFKKYSNPHKLDVLLMAITGLFFNKATNTIKCHFCKYTAGEAMTSNKEIVNLHFKYSRRCPLMTRRETANVPVDEIRFDLIIPPLIYDECGFGFEDRFSEASPIYRELKYPQFCSEAARLETYKNWPNHVTQKPEDLAESGFFYTGEDDKVKCFYCCLVIYKWESGDIAWVDHAKNNKTCYYVNFVKGKDFIEWAAADASSSFDLTKKIKPPQSETDCPPPPPAACTNCTKRYADVTFLPCDHTHLCAVCAISATTCPNCNTKVECRIKLWY